LEFFRGHGTRPGLRHSKQPSAACSSSKKFDEFAPFHGFSQAEKAAH
jgi:hypothetical protein